MDKLAFVVIAVILQSPWAQGATDCTPKTNPACLDAIKAALNQEDRFWFGSNFTSTCGGSNVDPIDCFTDNMRIKPPGSLKSLVFPASSVNLIDRFLTVTFKSSDVGYYGCDTHVPTWARTIDVDPLSDEAYPAAFLRRQPNVTWPTDGMDSNTRLVLIFVEVSSGRMLDLFTDIKGTDGFLPPRAYEIYRGSRPVRSFPSPVLILLYRQTVAELTTNIRDSPFTVLPRGEYSVNLDDFQSQYALQGPIAVNWVMGKRDNYSADYRNNNYIADSCATQVQQAVASQNRPWLSSPQPLSVFLSIVFRSTEITVNFCCRDKTYMRNTTILDPLANGAALGVDVRSDTYIMVRATKNKFAPDPTDFAGKEYTLLALDPDVPNAKLGTNERPLVHWLVINMNGVIDPSKGETLLKYSGPKPPDDKPHGYYFLLYEQQDHLTNVDPSIYVGSGERFLFDVARFVSDHQLTLLGASWMYVQNDYFINYLYRDSLDAEKENAVCEKEYGYNPCITTAAPIPTAPPFASKGGTLKMTSLIFLVSLAFSLLVY